MSYSTDVKIKVTPDEDQPPLVLSNKMVEMMGTAAGGSDWPWLPEWYHGPGWIKVDDVTVEEVDRLFETHGDPAWYDVTTISGEGTIEYWKSSGYRFVEMVKEYFGHGPDDSAWWSTLR